MKKPTPKQVTKARLDAELSTGEAAKLISVSQRAWQYYESGDREMPVAAWELFKLLINWKGEKNPG